MLPTLSLCNEKIIMSEVSKFGTLGTVQKDVTQEALAFAAEVVKQRGREVFRLSDGRHYQLTIQEVI